MGSEGERWRARESEGERGEREEARGWAMGSEGGGGWGEERGTLDCTYGTIRIDHL